MEESLKALLLGVVEGFTEFLPISSTGHLILAEKLLARMPPPVPESFKIAIQLGAILAVVALYWRSLLVDGPVMLRVAVAFVPTAVLGLVFYRVVKQLLGSEEVVLWALAVGGALLILFEWLHGERPGATDEVKGITFVQAFLIGVCQAAAFVPGVSRAAATVVGGLALGLRRRTVVEFSFLLAVPTMAAATGYDLYKSADTFSGADVQFLLVGLVTSFVVALLAVRFLLRFITTHTFIPFGVYRIAAALLFWLLW